MSLSSIEKTQLAADVQTLADHITALIVDPDPHPLQIALDEANAALTLANATLAAAMTENADLQTRAQAARDAIAAANTADATEDAARAAALAALG